MDSAQQLVLGDSQCYRKVSIPLSYIHDLDHIALSFCEGNATHKDTGLDFICTDPLYERVGAATTMLQWGIEKCRKSKHSIYLESTVESAPFYTKHGFQKMTDISMDLEDDGVGRTAEIYGEIGFLYRPSLT